VSPKIALGVIITEFISILISLVSASILLMTRMQCTVMAEWLMIITTTVTITPLVFVIVILLEIIVLQVAVIRV
jgi:hypothetical protein